MTNDKQKKLGAYYTPELVTDSLSAWAIRRPTDIVLEPSFGGCNFLTSSVKTLENLGSSTPYSNIFGFDIDSSAFNILKEKNLDSPNFFNGDFLESSLETDIRADVILGNPPYLPMHKLAEDYKLKIFALFKNSKIKIAKRSSIWIYFIVKSLGYLKEGGRMAWVVPDSISFTDYGKSFISQLGELFKTVKIARIEERYFSDSGTMEKTSLLLCEGYMTGSSSVEIYDCDLLTDALKFLKSQKYKAKIKNRTLVNNISESYKVVSLGSIFDVKIGIVIGATSLLTLTKEQAENSPYHPEFTYPIITKGKQLKGLSISPKELIEGDSNQPIYLIDAISIEKMNFNLFNQLLQTIPSSVLSNQTFRTRSKLFGYDDFKHPEAFLTFFAQSTPKLILNFNNELNCTNSLHRLYVKSPVDSSVLRFISLQFYCDFLYNDIKSLARPYGNSIYKYEPSDAKKIPVIIPDKVSKSFKRVIDNAYRKVEDQIKSGDKNEAKKTAFNVILTTVAKIS